MIRANEMNWLDFGSMVKTPNLAFQDAVGVFQQNSCMKKSNFKRWWQQIPFKTGVSICSNLDVTEGSYIVRR